MARFLKANTRQPDVDEVEKVLEGNNVIGGIIDLQPLVDSTVDVDDRDADRIAAQLTALGYLRQP